MPCNGVAVARVKLAGEVSDTDVLMALNDMGQTNARIHSPGVIKFGNYASVVRVVSELRCANADQTWMNTLSQKAQWFARQSRKRKAIHALKALGEVVEETRLTGPKSGFQLTIRF